MDAVVTDVDPNVRTESMEKQSHNLRRWGAAWAFFAAVFAIWMFFFPEAIPDHFAWIVEPRLAQVFIGAGYIFRTGFFLAFFSSHKRLWVRVYEQEGKTRIVISARSNKDPVGLEREREYLLRHFKKGS